MGTADRTQPVEVEAKTTRLREKIERLRKQVRQLGELNERLQGQEDAQLCGEHQAPSDSSTYDLTERPVRARSTPTGLIGTRVRPIRRARGV